MLERGVFTLSFDVELAWGVFHRNRSGRVEESRLGEAREAVPSLLELLARHDAPASFAVVGHLLERECPGHAGDPEPSYSFGPPHWYAAHPTGGEELAPLWYARSLVAAIRAGHPRHEVAAHGYTHAPLGEPGASADLASSEMGRARRTLQEAGYDAFSFVFPLNRIDYVEILKEQGFRCYRAGDARWYARAPGPMRKLCHGLDQMLGLEPRTGLPSRDGGVWRLPSSMLFPSREGWRRLIPMSSRVRRALAGLERARQRRQVFHMWLHLEDMVPDTPRMLAGLARVLAAATRLRQAGEIEMLTMRELVERVAS